MKYKAKYFAVCAKNKGYKASLELRKIYPVLAKEAHGLLRVIDESGEDYLYPAHLFIEIELKRPVARALHLAA